MNTILDIRRIITYRRQTRVEFKGCTDIGGKMVNLPNRLLYYGPAMDSKLLFQNDAGFQGIIDGDQNHKEIEYQLWS